MLIKTLIVVAALAAVFVIIVAMRPSAFRIVRSATIAAPPEVIFGQVDDFRAWQAWSPWEKLTRATVIPAASMRRIVSGLAEPGPMVATILVRAMCLIKGVAGRP